MPASTKGATSAAPPATAPKARHALVIGINQYDDAQPLFSCASDAERLGELLRSRGYRVDKLTDGLEATARITRVQVMTALRRLMKAAGPDDLVVVYISCHGGRDPKTQRAYLQLGNTPTARLATRGLALGTVLEQLRGKPRWVAVFLDVCKMGLGVDPEASASAMYNEDNGGGFALLAGGTRTQQTKELIEGGVFSTALIDGLAGAAAEADGSVSLSELARYVQRAVARVRADKVGLDHGVDQVPVFRLEVADLDLVPPAEYVDLDPPLRAKITDAAFSPDGLRLATASEDNTVRLWDPDAGTQVLTTMEHEHYVGGVAYAPSGLVLASCSADGVVKTWQAPGANEITPGAARIGHTTKVAWHPTMRRWAVGSNDGIHVYDGDSVCAPIRDRHLRGPEDFVWAVAFMPDGRLVSAGIDATVRFWDVDAGTCLETWELDGPIWAIAISRDGTCLATAGTDATVSPKLVNVPRLWDVRTRKELARLGGHGSGVTAIAFAHDQRLIATACYDGAARVWSASRLTAGDGSPITVTMAKQLVRVGTGKHVERPEAYGATFSPDASRLFVGYSDGRGRIFRLAAR